MLLHDIGKGRGRRPRGARGADRDPHRAAAAPRARRPRRPSSSWSAPTSRCRSSRSTATSPSRRSRARSRRRVGTPRAPEHALPPHLRRPPRRGARASGTTGRHRCSGSSTSSTRPLLVPGARSAAAATAVGPPGRGAAPASSATIPRRRCVPHFALVPERYLRATDADADPRSTCGCCGAGRATAWPWTGSERAGGARHRAHGGRAATGAGCFASLAGTLTARGVDILSVDLFTREDGVALDTFRVARAARARSPLEAERCERLRKRPGGGRGRAPRRRGGGGEVAGAAPRGRAGTGAARRHEPRVRFDAEASRDGHHRGGAGAGPAGPRLHASRTRCRAWGSTSRSRKIATAKALALDVFYVTDGKGRKLSPEAHGRGRGGAAARRSARDPRPRTS